MFMNQSKEGIGLNMATPLYLLKNLGFVINNEKSCFVSTQKLEFLGFVVDTMAMTLLLPDCKVQSIKSHSHDLLALQEVSVRDLSQLIGKLTASITSHIPSPFALRSSSASETPGFSPTKELRFHNTSIERGQG